MTKLDPAAMDVASVAGDLHSPHTTGARASALDLEFVCW
jgi:hypothetical protein